MSSVCAISQRHVPAAPRRPAISRSCSTEHSAAAASPCIAASSRRSLRSPPRPACPTSLSDSAAGGRDRPRACRSGSIAVAGALLDDEVVAVVFDHALELRVLVAGNDDELVWLCAHALVLAEWELDLLLTVRIAAGAEELRLLRLRAEPRRRRPLGQLLQVDVDLLAQVLVVGELPSASVRGARRGSSTQRAWPQQKRHGHPSRRRLLRPGRIRTPR